ncbi:hypothetical protein [Nocardia sp. NBC_01377]
MTTDPRDPPIELVDATATAVADDPTAARVVFRTSPPSSGALA